MNLKTFLRDYAVPVARDGGLVRSGGDFRMTSGSGNSAILSIEKVPIDSLKVVFGVSYSIVPGVYWEWVCRYDENSVRSADRAGAIATRFVIPAEELSCDPEGDGYFRRLWSYGVGTERECGAALSECLESEVIPEMGRMLDRSALLAELRNPTRPGVSALSQDLCEIFLRMDGMAVGELEESLAEAERNGAAPHLVAWLRQRSRGDD